MGDRAHVKVHFEPYGIHPGGDLYLYSHYHGYDWAEQLRSALEFGKGRWGDDDYLTRILISRMFSDIHDQETGGGVGMHTPDGYLAATVNLDSQTVEFAEQTYSFAEFVALGDLTGKRGY